MSRIKVLALAALLALGSLSFTTQASARGSHWGGGHWGGGHWGGGHWGGGFGFHRGFGFRRFGFWGGPYYYGYYPYGGCWRWRRVWTPYGLIVRRINVCYYPYY